jgi:hypothetical protein
MLRLFLVMFLGLSMQACDTATNLSLPSTDAVELNNVALKVASKGSAIINTTKNQIVLDGLGDCVGTKCTSAVAFSPANALSTDFHLQYEPILMTDEQRVITKWGSNTLENKQNNGEDALVVGEAYTVEEALYYKIAFTNPEVTKIDVIYYEGFTDNEITRIQLTKEQALNGFPIDIGLQGFYKSTGNGCWANTSGGIASSPQQDIGWKNPCLKKRKASNLPDHINIVFKPNVSLVGKQDLATFKNNSWMQVATANIQSITINEIKQVPID